MSDLRITGPLCVIGHPVAHTLSPRIHNAALVALGAEPVYGALDVSPDGLESAVRGLVSEGYAGFNVTIPHKQAVLRLVDVVAESARMLGAANTIAVDRSGPTPVLTAHNTDVAGFMEPLQAHAADLRGGRALVWGAGGAARAVLSGIVRLMDPEFVTVVARRQDRVFELARDLAGAGGSRVVAGTWPAPPHVLDDHQLLVNTTPLGMHPDPSGTPAPGGEGLRAGQVVYDLVYRPALTRLLLDAAARGAATIGGLPMLVAQAAAAFRIWTGADMPLAAVRSELESLEP